MSKASDALLAWVEHAESLPEGKTTISPEAKDIAAGFATLGDQDQARFLTLLHERAIGPRTHLVDAIATTKDTSVLEEQLRWVWETDVIGRVGAGDRFAQLALVRGRVAEAATLMVKLRSFTAYSGLANKLDAVIAAYPLDDELLELAAQALHWGSATSSNSQECWGLSAFLLHSEQDRFLHAVVSCAYSFLNPFHPRLVLAERLCDIIDTYGRTNAAATLSIRLRAIIATFPQ